MLASLMEEEGQQEDFCLFKTFITVLGVRVKMGFSGQKSRCGQGCIPF